MKSSSMQPMMKSEPTMTAARTELELGFCVCFPFPQKKIHRVIVNTVQSDRKPLAVSGRFFIFYREVSRPLSGGLVCGLVVPLQGEFWFPLQLRRLNLIVTSTKENQDVTCRCRGSSSAETRVPDAHAVAAATHRCQIWHTETPHML